MMTNRRSVVIIDYAIWAAVVAVLVALIMFFLVTAANAQSFNCRYSKSPDEVAICQDESLRMFDTLTAQVYSRAVNQSVALKPWLLRSQVRWLEDRKSCGSDVECIASVYVRRMEALLKAIEKGL